MKLQAPEKHRKRAVTAALIVGKNRLHTHPLAPSRGEWGLNSQGLPREAKILATSAGRKVRRFSCARGAKSGSSAKSDFNLSQADCGWMNGKYFCASSALPKVPQEFVCIDLIVLRHCKDTIILADNQIISTDLFCPAEIKEIKEILFQLTN